MSLAMPKRSRFDLLKAIKTKYDKTTRKPEKTRLLNYLCEGTGWERKYALKLLAGKRGPLRSKPPDSPSACHGGPRIQYTADVVAALKNLWRQADYLCGKRLKPVIEIWTASWERRHGPLDAEVRRKLLAISAAQIDRVLAAHRIKEPRPRLPHTINEVRRQVPLRTGPWQETEPGWMEADTVMHDGGNPSGCYGVSLVMTDIATQWTELRMSWGKSDLMIFPKIQQIEAALPFALLGFDSDNGGEFINTTLMRYLSKRTKPVQQTRSRPYHKNDNAHVEQKNRVLVRENIGYDRIGTKEAAAAYDEVLRLLSIQANLYHANMKLLGKERPDPNQRWKRKYEKEAKTPYQRVMASATVSEQRKNQLKALWAKHDPISLKEEIEKALGKAITLREKIGTTVATKKTLQSA